jgi:hypothetical protein
MQAPLQYGQQQQPQQGFSAAGMAGGQQRFGGMGGQQFGGVYGSLGFAGGDASLIQQGTSPGGMGMYNIGGGLQQLQPQQHLQAAAQQQGGLNGYPGQLDMAKLNPLTGGANAQGAAAAAAAAMAAKGYTMQSGLGSARGFPGFAAGGQQAFAGQAEPGGYPGGDPAAAVAAAAAGYGAEAVAHMQGTSPLGTTPEFASFGAGGGAWGS